MGITPVPDTALKVHVYELSNRTRLESLLVLSAEDSTAVSARLKREPPPEASFWHLSDDVETVILAQHMNAASAEQFLQMHLEHMQQRTWRFHIWRPQRMA